MSNGKNTRKETMSTDLQRADCLLAYCPKAVFHINAETVKAQEVVKNLRQHAVLIAEATAAKAKWLKAVADERALAAELKPVMPVVAHYVTNVLGIGSEAYIAFGLAATKSTTPTVPEKALAVEKRAATREARHTMGKKAKLKIRGNVDASNAVGSANANGSATPSANAAPHAPAVVSSQTH